MSTTALVPIEQQLANLDRIASESNILALVEGGGQFSAALEVADKMNALREALTPEIMERFMKLQGSALGFKTDKDNENGYPVAVVREVLIEATFKGFRLVGNETNVIGGRFYGTREGFEARMRDLSKKGLLTDLKITPGIPKTVGDGAIVHMDATWKWRGKGDSISLEIPIRVNKFQGADAILGKARRKLLAAIYSRVTGTEITDGEVADGDLETMKRAETTTTPPPAPREFCDEETVKKLEEAFADYEAEVNTYLQKEQLVEAGESFRKVSPKLAGTMLKKRDSLLENAGVIRAKK